MTKDQPQIAFSGKFGKNGAKRLHSENIESCILNPYKECRKFQSLKVAERWNCSKCSRPHHVLLHDDRPNRADSSSDTAVSSTPSQGESRSDSTTVGELQDDDDGNEQVYLILLTAIKHDEGGQTCERIPFYAAIDTWSNQNFVFTLSLTNYLVIEILTHWN